MDATWRSIAASLIVFSFFLLMPVTSLSDMAASAGSVEKPPSEMRQFTVSIQVASHKILQNAQKDLKRLQSHGLNPFMRHELVPNKGMWYRIYVGRFENKKEATQFARTIKDQGIISGYWVKRIEILPEEQPPSAEKLPEKIEKPVVKIEAEPEKQVPPAKTVEIPIPVISTEEEKPPVPAPVETSKDMQPEKTEEPVALEEKEALLKKEKGPMPVREVPDEEKIKKFSVGIKSSLFFAPNAENFSIKLTSGTNNKIWSFQDQILFNSLISSYRVTSRFLLECGLERAFFSDLDLWNFSLGPKFEFRSIGMLTPYARGGLLYSRLEWDEIPGDFNGAWGWEGGLGVFYRKSDFQIGMEAAYRGIEYDYNPPSDPEITANDGSLDYSGYALSLTVGFLF